jgi:hypothetical protein
MSEGIQVQFFDATGAKVVKAKVAPSVTVKNILPSIITKMLLPVTSPDGQPMSYSLDAKRLGMRLREDKTLLEQGIQEGDILIVYPDIVAGALIQEIWAFVGEDGEGEEALLGAEVPGIGWMPFVASSQDGLALFTPVVKDAVDQGGIRAKVVRFVTREDVETVS